MKIQVVVLHSGHILFLMKAGALEYTELFNIRPASSWNEWKTVKSGYSVDIQGDSWSQWHCLGSALRSAVKKKTKNYRVFSNCVSRIPSNHNVVTRTKSKNEKTRSKNY